MRHLPRACAAGFPLVSAPAAAAPLCDDLGFAGLPAGCDRGEPIALTLASGRPLFEGTQPVELQSGACCEIEITSDGSAELALAAPGSTGESQRVEFAIR